MMAGSAAARVRHETGRARHHLIVALDTPDLAQARALVDQLSLGTRSPSIRSVGISSLRGWSILSNISSRMKNTCSSIFQIYPQLVPHTVVATGDVLPNGPVTSHSQVE
jgi:hypothetical protein